MASPTVSRSGGRSSISRTLCRVRLAFNANVHALARYASLCQEQELVPIVEPEVLMDGPHTIERCEEVTGVVLHAVFHALFKQGVVLEGMLLKPNMVLAGKDCDGQASVEEVAASTLRCLRRHVPARGAWHRVPVGRPKRQPGFGQSERDQPTARPEALEGQFLLRAGAAGSGSGGLAWAGREYWTAGKEALYQPGRNPTGRRASESIRMRWRWHRQAPMIRRIAATGATTDAHDHSAASAYAQFNDTGSEEAIMATALSDGRERASMDAFWRAANFLSVGQIYLFANPLLSSRSEHIKPRLLGHWGTSLAWTSSTFT